VPEPLLLQKLLTAPVAAAIVETGSDQVGGYVAAASEVAALRTPSDLLAAYGIDGSPEFADVVRFGQPRLATFSAPPSEPRPWQTFPSGFLLGDSLARVWSMGRTRYPYGAELEDPLRRGTEMPIALCGGRPRLGRRKAVASTQPDSGNHGEVAGR
jgi:hypothetical protein